MHAVHHCLIAKAPAGNGTRKAIGMDEVGRGADHCFHDRDVNVLARAGQPLPQQGGHNGNGGIAGRYNGHLFQHCAHGGRIGTARGIQEAAHSLGNEVTTLIGRYGPVCPKGVMETTIKRG